MTILESVLLKIFSFTGTRVKDSAMKSTSLLSASIVVIFLAAIPRARAAMPLPRSTPEAQGVSSQAIADFVAAADKINTLHSCMILRHGHVIAEAWWKPEAADKPHTLWS